MSGTSYSTSNSWVLGSYNYPLSGTTDFLLTANATFSVTGVQLEKSSVATPLEWNAQSAFSYFPSALMDSSTACNAIISFSVTMRTTPTTKNVSSVGNFRIYALSGGSTLAQTTVTAIALSTDGQSYSNANFAFTASTDAFITGGFSILRANSLATACIDFSAEL
ncbi:hypothetical protein BDK51DRAFT_39968 [Blyttiomyces helicus]|uniref:Uncharacterized protein n=1 Tax=Blyttiomyces helicus TaxID=388810 RepID=A0A4V1ISS1_9FUNG|nr:hypothetical protein BDK51DRAFT_39968 [Blyttiomyces helicus]|eukprot:RKO94537.1 hypothetical protein BDK51DRAFT_39968 [Blyttiomyces helicus]